MLCVYLSTKCKHSKIHNATIQTLRVTKFHNPMILFLTDSTRLFWIIDFPHYWGWMVKKKSCGAIGSDTLQLPVKQMANS